MIRASVHIEQPVIGIEYILPVVDVSYILITFSAQTDDRGLYRKTKEFSIVFDAATLDVNKAFSEALSAALDVFAWSFTKSAADNPKTLDTPTLTAAKPLTDTAVANEVLARAAGYIRAFNEVIFATDDLDGEASPEDDQEIQFTKARSDLAHALDVFSRVVFFSRDLIETPKTVELVARDVHKVLTDGAQSGDLPQILVSKPFLDAVISTDIALRAYQLGKFEAPQLFDILVASVTKPFTDAASALDTPAKTVDKPAIADLCAAADTFEKVVGFIRTFNDTAFATDDLDGEASPEDDQEIQFTKARSDLTHALDVLNRTVNYLRAFTDSAASPDLPQLHVTKPFTDAAASADALLLNVTLGRVEPLEAVDALVALVIKPLTELPVALDTPAKTIEKPTLADTADAADFDLKLDIMLRIFNTAHATDDLDGEASPEDDQEIQFVKARNDAGLALEQHIKSTSKPYSDSVGSADSGSLINQDYFDSNDYFAEDYFGTSRTF